MCRDDKDHRDYLYDLLSKESKQISQTTQGQDQQRNFLHQPPQGLRCLMLGDWRRDQMTALGFTRKGALWVQSECGI
jgi:hypothetical protein